MRKIGLIIAVKKEFDIFLSDHSLNKENLEDCPYFTQKIIINNNEIYVLESGFGEIDGAAATQYLITKYSVDLILNYGVVGALKKDLKVSDLFLVSKVVHYDFDASKIDGTKPGQYLEFSDEYMETKKEVTSKVFEIMPEIKSVILASGDTFIVDKTRKSELEKRFNASICDMEAAGIIRVCYKNQIEAILIKCISDTFDGDGSDYIKNVASSSKKAFNLIKELLAKL